MRRLVGFLLIACTSQASFIAAAQERSTQIERFYVEPPEVVSVVIGFQPDCGLEFTKALVLRGVESGVAYTYQVRNKGSKPIRSYRVAALTSIGTGSEWGFEGKDPDRYLLPGYTIPTSDLNNLIEIVPLTDELRAKRGVREPLKGVVIFIVVRVDYSDGSKYDASAQYQALKRFFDRDFRERSDR